MAISSMTRIRRQDDRPSPHRRRWRQAPPGTTRAATSTTYPFLLLYDHHDHRVAEYSIQSRRLTYICVDELCQHWFRQWLVAWTAPSQYPIPCWNFDHFSKHLIFIKQYTFENVVCCGMPAILPLSHRDKISVRVLSSETRHIYIYSFECIH